MGNTYLSEAAKFTRMAQKQKTQLEEPWRKQVDEESGGQCRFNDSPRGESVRATVEPNTI